MNDMQQPAPMPVDSPDAMLRVIADSVPALIAYYEAGTQCCRFSNSRYARYNGWTPETILGKTVREVVGDAAWLAIAPFIEQATAGQATTYTREQTLPDGQKRMISVNLRPHIDAAGAVLGSFVLINDVTEDWRAEQATRDSEERMRKFVAATTEGIAFHKDTLITDVNDALIRIGGYSREEMIGHVTLEFVPPERRQVVVDYISAGREDPYESALIHKNGHEIPVEMVAKTISFGGETCRLVVVRDISVRKEAQARIEFMALHDPLTQLPNRAYLTERLNSILAMSRRRAGATAILFIDLDNFKTVNDSLGHPVGDALLVEVARRVSATVRDADVVSRLGGDEFLVVLSEITCPEDAARVAAKLIQAVSAVATIDGHKLVVSPSVGISVFPADGDTAEDLIRHADAAMYHAKESGRSNYQFFVPALFERAVQALNNERRLREALVNNEFVLHYQPKRRRSDGAVDGLEALVRWQHPERGLVGPNEFIALAEERGLIAGIDRWVLQAACHQLKAWQDKGYLLVPVAVNLSAVEFKQRDLVLEVSAVLAATGIEARYLEIELTESVLMDHDSQVLETLNALSSMGVGLTIDDFGTGYSSLGYLKRYPISKLKIDRCFVSGVTGGGHDLAITTAIIQMARSLKLETVAEGIETQAQMDVLRELGCDQFQGFLISHPLPAADIRVFLESKVPEAMAVYRKTAVTCAAAFSLAAAAMDL
jgi:diguanylate cyclase (GGDEF)-like protein/PAS domain S-box-containing protein